MDINNRKKISRKFVLLISIFSLISVLTLTAIPVSACHYKIGTFESDYETSKDSFFKGEIVYGMGKAIGYNYPLKLRIRDPDGNIVFCSNQSQYVVYCSFFLNDSVKTGTWNIQLGIFKNCCWEWSTCYGRIAYFSVSDANFTLTVNINGNGTVTKDPDNTYYSYGSVVDISAEADLGSSFKNWTGDLNSCTNPEGILMDSDKTVTANFIENQYVISIEIIGNGSVELDPEVPYYTYGSTVNLTAIPEEDWNFNYWNGNISGDENPKTIIIDDDKDVVAVFSMQEPVYILTVNIDGEGVVEVDVPGQYFYGDIVNLTAIPCDGNTFSHWSEDLSGNYNPETIVMNENKNVTAHFVIEEKEKEEKGDNGGGGVASIPEKSNRPPVADLSAGESYIGFVEEEIDFNGSLSYDNDGYIVEWFWNFGDGTTGLGEIISHNYSSPGTYTVILIVTDNKGVSDSDLTTAEIVLPNNPPTVPNVSGPTDGFVDIEYLFSIFSTDEDGDDIKYTVDWGDGNIDESMFLKSGDLFNISHMWTEPGDFTINVSANDSKKIVKIDITITLDERDIPEQSNIIVIIILIIALLLVLLFLILSKPKKDKPEEEN